MKKLTEREQEVFDYVVEYWNKQKRSPLLKEIAEGLHLSGNLTTGVARAAQLVGALETKGRFIRKRGHRNIYVKAKSRS